MGNIRINRAVFLDRDGVINRKGGSYYIFRKKDFIINEGVYEALDKLSKKGFLLIVITNQGCVSKGICSTDAVESLHKHMCRQFEEKDITISAVYYCPHHPDNEHCDCRKPGHLLFEKAISEFNIDRSASVMIGDSEIDITAARRAGIKGIKVETNCNLMEEEEIMLLIN